MTEVWFRNPHNYIRELVESGSKNIAWDRGMLVKKRIDALKHAKVHYGEHADFRILCIGEQGTVELDAFHDIKNPRGVYPTWEYGDDWAALEEMVAKPIGLDDEACGDDSLPTDERPIYGQDHIVVISKLPNFNLSSAKALVKNIRALQEDFPECYIYLHGSYAWSAIFGSGLGGGDVDPRQDAQMGRVILPNGKRVAWERAVGEIQWVNLCGFKITDLKVPRNRCIFNIKSAEWASENWEKNVKIKSRGGKPVDYSAPMTPPQQTANIHSKSKAALPGDKIACNSCSLAIGCKYYREDAVCSIPGTDSSTLAKIFQSRDADKIIDGLGAVLGVQAERAEQAIETERAFDELDPEATKILNILFNQGEKLAKLLNPALRGGPKVAVNVHNGAASLSSSNENQILKEIVADFERRGIGLADITPQMMEDALSDRFMPQQQLTQGVVVQQENSDDD